MTVPVVKAKVNNIAAHFLKRPNMTLRYAYQIGTLNDCIWVHCSDGSTVGRFGKFGIDIHTPVTSQLRGSPQCEICTHARVTAADWKFFRQEAEHRWGVHIPEDAFSEKYFGISTDGAQSPQTC